MIEWSSGAEQQLFEIRLGFHSAATLEKFEEQLDAALEQLETFPESARTHPVLHRSDVRYVMVGEYRLTILMIDDRILVFSLVHARSGAAFD